MRKAIKRALVSVYDKDRIIEVGKALSEKGIEIISTGSTAMTLAAAGIKVIEVSNYTNTSEILDGRVKTLHPKLHSGILADQNNPEHLAAIKSLGIEPFDLIIINLYPFLETISSGATDQESIEHIDIGGPALLRGAAKNYSSVAVISNPNQYDELIVALNQGGFTLTERKKLATESFRTTAEYDIAIANWLGAGNEIPDWLANVWKLNEHLRYGENPHQRAAFYKSKFSTGVAIEQLHGKTMSFNNYIDADAAWRAVQDQHEPAAVIIKHTNPCGIAVAKNVSGAFEKAYACDPTSAYGAVVAVNQKVDSELINKLADKFIEVLVAPDYEQSALKTLMEKPQIRILKANLDKLEVLQIRQITGGLLLQEVDYVDAPGDNPENWQQVSGEKVSPELIEDLKFAWRAVRAIKSNGILLAKNGASVGIGMGQVNRVDAAKLAVIRAGNRASGSVAASDAYFPFADGLEILITVGISAIVQPGGSIRDEEVIAAAKSKNIPMFFTGVRHFAHA